MSADPLMEAVSQVDVIDLAGRIIADPRRTSISTAGGLALAQAFERAWEIVVEADVLVNALERTMPWETRADAEHCEHVALQAGHVRTLIAALSGEAPTPTQENEDGRHHS